jgi:hypothetical protein
VDAVQNEVIFEYIPSDLVPLSHCRFIVDFMAEHLKHCQFCQSSLHLYNALGVRPSQKGGSEMQLLVFLILSALEKYCSFVNLPDGSLSDIARLLQTIKYKLYLRPSATQENNNT